MKIPFLTSLLFLLIPLADPVSAAGIALKEQGIAIGNAGQLSLTLAYPKLLNAAGKQSHALFEKTVTGNSATLKYEGGASAQLTIAADKLRIAFTGLPAEAKHLELSSQLSFGLSEGGSWQIDQAAPQAFPAQKSAKPHLFQGSGRGLTLRNEAGATLTCVLSQGGYLELLDGRAWDWKTFILKAKIALNSPDSNLELRISSTAPENAAPAPPKVDPFGQSNKKDWPHKVSSVEQLKADALEDEQYYASFSPPATGAYGGYAGTREKLGLTATGYFHVQKVGERWWLVDPEGNAFFHLGMGGFALPFWTHVKGRESTYEWLPPLESEYKSAYLDGSDPGNFSFYCANWIRKYGKPFDQEEFTTEMIRRVRLWGFNSNGHFSGRPHQAYRDQKFPHVAGLNTNDFPAVPGLARAFDPFSEKGLAKFDKKLSESLPKNLTNPLIIGYFMGNEPILEDIPRVIPALKGDYPCKQALVRMLETRYGTIAAFNAAWNMEAASFADLNTQGLPISTEAAAADMKAYTELFVDKLYSVVATTFRKYDKNHLLIGNRLQYGTINNEMVCRTMAKHVDVVSFNYYTYAFDNEFLKKIHAWTGKPMILSEFAWNAPDSGLGGPKDLESQEQRGLAYRNYVEQAAALGFVVGTEWYQLIDEPVTGLWWGKYSGPNGNNGMIAVTDRPWKEMVENVARANYHVHGITLEDKAPFLYEHPLFRISGGGSRTVKVPRATGPIRLDGSMEGWPGLPAEIFDGKLVQGASAESVSATFKVCWDDRHFYLMMNVLEPTPMRNARSASDLWQGDTVELFFGPQNTGEPGMLLPGDRHVLLSAASPVPGSDASLPRYHFVRRDEQPPLEMTVIPHVDGTGYTLEAAIPFSSLGFTPNEGDAILFDIALDDSESGTARLRQFMWNGASANASDRGAWGKAIFDR